MFTNQANTITDMAQMFLEPANSTHRQYEALRAYFVEKLSAKEVGERFGYTEGSVRVLAHKFRNDPHRPFFLAPAKGPQRSPKKDQVREQVISLRKQNLSIYDISRALGQEAHPISPVSVSAILKEEGFARLPRRRDEERPPHAQRTKAAVADVRELDLTPRDFRTKFGGLYLFVPYLANLPLGRMVKQAGLPGSDMVPPAHALRSLLGLKLFGSARHSHVMSDVLDEGLALFAGLNAIPKRSFLTEYSCRIAPECYPKIMRAWFGAVGKLGLPRGDSFDLDFHTIPFHGEDALVQKHYVCKRSRRQKGMLAFVAQDAGTRVFCYGNAHVRKEDQNDEILQFVQFWKQRTGRMPEELIFDSKLTTYANLHQLNQKGIRFITLRRRSAKMLEAMHRVPPSAWRRVELENMGRAYRTPRILDQPIELRDYQGPLRQIVITDLGHEEPTFLLTNQLRRSARKLIGRYAQRMVVENTIEDGIDFFHMDALSSAVAMKVNCDLQLTLMASSLYRLLGLQIAEGYERAKSRKIFRDFVNATARVSIQKRDIIVRFHKRAHNPLLINAGLDRTETRVPWLGRKRLRLVFG
jgi:transposase